MRSRTVREGSVGLLILLGLALFGAIALWLRGISFGKRSYSVTIEFANASGMQVGAPVRYRGVQVGQITDIETRANGVDVTAEIGKPDLHIPDDVLIEANQSGFISDTFIDITPLSSLPTQAKLANPVNSDCNSDLIICDGDRLQGEIGVSYEQLIRSTVKLSTLFGDPRFFANVNSAAENIGLTAAEAAKLSNELTLLSRSVRQEIQPLSEATKSVSRSANVTAAQISQTAEQLDQLATNVNALVLENQESLVGTLNNISDTSEELRRLVISVAPTVERVNTAFNETDTEQLVENLETLTANAAEVADNLSEITNALSEPTNLLVLEKTLDSARVTFENTQKITSDLDQLTGDPQFRTNLRELINGLSDLVSSTQQLEQQVYNAQILEPVNDAINLTTADSFQLDKQSSALEFQPTVPEDQLAPPASPSKKKRSSRLVVIPEVSRSDS